MIAAFIVEILYCVTRQFDTILDGYIMDSFYNFIVGLNINLQCVLIIFSYLIIVSICNCLYV